jgi:hypothetical protein
MTCYTAEYEGKLTPNAEIEKMDFFSYEDKLKCSMVDHLIFDDLKHKNLIR